MTCLAICATSFVAATAAVIQVVVAVQNQLADVKSTLVILVQPQAVVAKSTLAILAAIAVAEGRKAVCSPSCSRRSQAVTLVATLAAAAAIAAVALRTALLLQLQL
jgi:hypothetical protein